LIAMVGKLSDHGIDVHAVAVLRRSPYLTWASG
jgi:hypothetical protein